MDAMDDVMRSREQATVEIDLGHSWLYPESNLTEFEFLMLRDILTKLKNRNFNMGVRGAMYRGYVYAPSEITLGDNGTPKLSIYVQF